MRCWRSGLGRAGPRGPRRGPPISRIGFRAPGQRGGLPRSASAVPPHSAQPDARAGGAVLDVDSGFHSGRGQPGLSGAQRGRAPSHLGEPPARISKSTAAARSVRAGRCDRFIGPLFQVHRSLRRFPGYDSTFSCISVFAAVLGGRAFANPAGELRFCLRADPKTFDPLQVEDDNSEAVRYLTGGVLLRVDRKTQEPDPRTGHSWKVDQQGRRITFQLRHDVAFSDGTPFSADDVAYTMTAADGSQAALATADPFRSSNAAPQIAVRAPDRYRHLRSALRSPAWKGCSTRWRFSRRTRPQTLRRAGAFHGDGLQAGRGVLLDRNPQYWKFDAAGPRLPYLRPDSPGDPAEPRYGAGAFPARRNRLDQFARPGHIRPARAASRHRR